MSDNTKITDIFFHVISGPRIADNIVYYVGGADTSSKKPAQLPRPLGRGRAYSLGLIISSLGKLRILSHCLLRVEKR